jgi:predicted dienelactone hydrolase
MRGELTRRALLAAAGLVVLPSDAASPAGASAQDVDWTDTARGRTLPLRVRWPDGAGPWPLLLFSHGLGGSREGADVWGEAWREAGFVVIHLQHPGSDTKVWLQGMNALRGAANATQWLARVADVKFVLDDVARRHAANESGWSRLRLDAIGMSGHSFGAHTTLALAGKRYTVPTPGLADDRLRAFMAFSPAPGSGAMSPHDQFAGVTRPMMCLTGSLDGDPFGSFSDGAPRWRVFDALPAGAKAGLWLDAADHMSFAGLSVPMRVAGALGARDARAVEATPRHQALIAGLSAQWWRATLMDDRAAAAALKQPRGLGPADRWVIG